MLCSRWVILLTGLTAAAALGSAPDPPPAEPGVPPSSSVLPDDPFPIARVRVSEDQLPEAVKQLDAGPLVRLPRSEFESRVRAASTASATAKIVPRLAEATYTATLAGDDLTGTAEWVILNPLTRPAAFPLDPFRLALRSATWADGREAAVGVLGPGLPSGPAVWVEGSGKQVLQLKWSAAGTTTAGERRFELRVPPCPVASLELMLAVGQTPTLIGADAMLSGPFPVSGRPKLRAWRFRFGDRGALEFAVRGPGDANATGSARAALVAKYELTPGQLTCSFEYDLLPTRGSVREWAFDVDPAARVTDAVVYNRAGWQVVPAASANQPARLRVTLRQPSAGGKVLITAVAPLTGGSLPMVRPVGAIVGEERIEVRVHPDLKLGGWSPGDYRLTENTLGPEQGRLLTWVGGLLPAGVDEPFRRPPAVFTEANGSDFTTREAIEWRVENGYLVLVARVSVRVRRGPLFGLTLQTPAGFERRRVTAGTDDLIGYVGNATGGTRGIVVEFVRPLATGQQAELRYELRGPAVPTPAGRAVRLPFPRVAPLRAAEREGWVSLGPVHGWVVAADLTSGPAPTADPLRADPPLPADTVAAFAFRGREPEGWVTLHPIRSEFTAETVVRVRADGPRWTATTRFDLNVRAGSVSSITVFEPGSPERGRTWAVVDGSNAIVSAVPIDLGPLHGANPLFAAPIDLRAAVVQARITDELPWTHGTFWVLRLARPATGRLALETTQVEQQNVEEAAGNAVAFRRLILCGAELATPRVELDPSLAARMQGAIAQHPGEANPLDRWFPSRIVVSPRPATPEAPPASVAWAFAGLYHITAVTEDAAEVIFGGTVRGPAGTAFPLTLPSGAEVQSVAAGGRWLGPGVDRAGAVVHVPVAAGGAVAFEVRYRLPANGRTVTSPLPELPGGPHEVRRWWAFRSGMLAVWPWRGWDQVEANELPIAIDHAVRFDGDAVLVVPTRTAVSLGVAVAALIVVVGWIGVRKFPFLTGCLLIAPVIVLGLAALLGPPAWSRAAVVPLAASLGVFAAAAVARGWKRSVAATQPSRSSVRTTTAAAVVLLSVFTLGLSQAQPPAADTVFILPGPLDAPQREVVVAPRALLDRLEAATKLPEPVAVITAANYAGQVGEVSARLTARFTIESFRDGEASVTLPLSDVRLESASVNGKPAFPMAVRPDLYTVTLPARGRHEVEVRFTTPVSVMGPEREVKFGVPEVPAAQLTLSVPGGPELIQTVGRVGGQKVTSGGSVQLEADLGNVRAVQVRWRLAGGGAPGITYREACVWDVSESETELNVCYQLRVEKGSVSQLRIDLPAEVEPTRVAVRPGEVPAAAPVVLRDWRLEAEKDGFRPLIIELAGPTDGRLVVNLECVPRRATTRRPVLRFPRMNTPGATPVPEGVYYVFRSNRAVVEDVAHVGLVDLTPDDLLFHFSGTPDLKLDPMNPGRVFKPTGRPVRPELRPTLSGLGPEPTATAETTWRVGPARADVEGVFRWQASQPLPAIEFDLPELRVFGAKVPRVAVAEVRGAGVAGWGQVGGRVQVWFRKPVREGAVEWVGRTPPFAVGNTGPVAIAAATPRPVGLRLTSDTVRVRTDADSAMRVTRDQGWKPTPANPGREWAFTTDQPAPAVLLQLFPPGATGSARGFGLVEVSGSNVVYRGMVEVPVRPGRPHRLAVFATGLQPQTAVELDLPPGITMAEQKSTGAGRTWVLDVTASPAAVVRVSVVVRFPAGGEPVRLPAIGARPVELAADPDGAVRWVGVAGTQPGVTLRGVVAAGLADVRTAWPGEAERLRRAGGSVWAVPAGSGPPLLVFDRSTSSPAASAPGTAPTPPVIDSTSPAPAVGHTSTRLLWPVLGWVVGAAVLFALFVLLPRATWPEQLGLAGTLFGVAVVGGWWVGVVVWIAARIGQVIGWPHGPMRFSRAAVSARGT